MLDGWEKVGEDIHQWYRREFEVVSISFRIDLWSVSRDDNEWAFSFNEGKPERFIAKTPDRAMLAAQALLAGYLRSAAKICRMNEQPALSPAPKSAY